MKERLRLFGKTKQLISQINIFLDRLSSSAIHFEDTFSLYLRDPQHEELEEKMEFLFSEESKQDELRRQIEAYIFEKMLIPDLRVDVMRLLEKMDKPLNSLESLGHLLLIERPDIPDYLRDDLKELCEKSVKSIDYLTMAVRAFFMNINDVHNHTQKVVLYENMADKVELRIRRKIFASDMELAEKVYFTSFTNRIADLADLAENITDMLLIYTLKRRM